METLQLEILLDIIAFVSSAALGVMIFFKDTKSWTNRLFFVLSVLINAYIVVNYISLHPPTAQPETQLFWIRVVMFVTSFIGPALVVFIHTFPGTKVTLRYKYLVPLLGLMSVSAVFALSSLVFKGIEYPNGSPVPQPGAGIPVFILDFVGMFILSFGILIYKFRHASGVDKNRLLYMLVGVFASFSLMGATTVIFVAFLKTSSFVFLGPVFTVILMACIAYATVKYQLFNLKVFATEMLVGVLWILLLSKVFTSGSVSERIADVSIFLVTLVTGSFLVRSVAREVRQREQLENLTEELSSANVQLKQLDQARADFLTLTSHQLRTPPATIKWYLAAIQSGDFGKLPQEAADAIAKTEVTNNALISLIDDLLNASRIERGKLEFLFEPVKLDELTKFTVEQLQPQAHLKGLELKFEPSPTPVPEVIADKEKVRQVVNNFIDNAIKYSPKGTIIARIKVDSKFVSVEVQDSGKGIDADVIASLFHKYSRGKDSVTHATGIGIGLYVAKIVVENHKGEIGAQSEGVGKGSIFYFRIPIKNDLPHIKMMDLVEETNNNTKT